MRTREQLDRKNAKKREQRSAARAKQLARNRKADTKHKTKFKSELHNSHLPRAGFKPAPTPQLFRPTLAQTPAPVPVIDKQPLDAVTLTALRERAKRRALIESFRCTPSKGPSAEQERRNLQWAEREAARIAKEERQRQANRALDWKFNGAGHVGTQRGISKAN